MNSGAPGKKCGGMKGGQGLINVYRGSCYQNPQPPFLPLQPSLIPLLQKRLKIYSVGSISARAPFVFKEVPLGKHASSTFSYSKSPSSFYYSSTNKVDPFERPTLVSDHTREVHKVNENFSKSVIFEYNTDYIIHYSSYLMDCEDCIHWDCSANVYYHMIYMKIIHFIIKKYKQLQKNLKKKVIFIDLAGLYFRLRAGVYNSWLPVDK